MFLGEGEEADFASDGYLWGTNQVRVGIDPAKIIN
jgi:hypothetical protein